MSRHVLARIACAAVAACCADRTAAASAYDTVFDDVMARYELPGLALGVIEDGEVVYSRTAGEVVAGSGKAVTADTLFKIASNSKAMTTALMARLVAAGKLDWDAPVTTYLPSFRMHDPWVTQHMLVRDLLVHDSGLREGAGDLMLWPEPNAFTRADILSGLAYLRPQIGFRSGYAYDALRRRRRGCRRGRRRELRGTRAPRSLRSAAPRLQGRRVAPRRCRLGSAAAYAQRRP